MAPNSTQSHFSIERLKLGGGGKDDFFSGHFIWCLIVNSGVSLKNLKSQTIEMGGGGGH